VKVYLHEIKDSDTEISLDENASWLATLLRECDEDKLPIQALSLKKTKPVRPIEFNVNLRKVDDIFVVTGDLNSHIDLLCSRCASSFAFPLDEHFSHIYCQDKEMAGISYLDKESKPKNQNKGFARHAASTPSETKLNESTDDLEITYVAEDYIELSDLLREVISLRLPYQPLCKEDCKGICPQCGTDLNAGRCACAKVQKQNAFSVLQNFPHIGAQKKTTGTKNDD
jgi:uncharacterized protein